MRGADVTATRLPEKMAHVRAAAMDSSPVSGLTHTFYRYPARFSPTLAAAAIEEFSSPGDLVLDPFVGGGTTVVEAMVRGRVPVGSDINSLATFVTKAKTASLSAEGAAALKKWAEDIVPTLSYRTPLHDQAIVCAERSRNLSGPASRHLKKIVALALERLPVGLDATAEMVGRCAILATSQWALDGRKRIPSAGEFRAKLGEMMLTMIGSLEILHQVAGDYGGAVHSPIVLQCDAADLMALPPFSNGTRADLVVTSPPYPGIHVLYHRWQVDGRRETPAPYWVTASMDGQGGAYYTFGDHRRPDRFYFDRLRDTMSALRELVKTGAYFVQAVAFQNPDSQLPKYVRAMSAAGFREARPKHANRIWRAVPGRKWHAYQKGDTPASREVVLIHQAD